MSVLKINSSSQEVVHEGRVAPYYEPTGLPVWPRKLACLGVEVCPAIEKTGRCNPKSVHHLLFPHALFVELGGPYEDLVENPFMKVQMAECRHNVFEMVKGPNRAMHALYDRSEVPDAWAAYSFLDETRLLRRMKDSVDTVQGMVAGYRSGREDSSLAYRARERDVVKKRAKRIGETFEVFDSCIAQVPTLEVVPDRIVNIAVTRILNKRRRILDFMASEACPDPIRAIAA